MKIRKAVIQKDLKDCGICCMQYIFSYYDGYITLEKLREDTMTNEQGTSAYHIIITFKKWGFDSHGALVHDLKDKEINFPLIAHIKLENGLEHFVVVNSINRNTIYLMDPSVGYKKLTGDEFNKLFSGYIIVMHPREELIKMDKAMNISKLFLIIMSKEKFLFYKIILSSILCTVLVIISSYYLKIGSNYIVEENALRFIVNVFFIITTLKVIVTYIREYYKNHLHNRIDLLVYPSFIKHIFRIPLKSINQRTSGEIFTRVEEIGFIKELFIDVFIACFLDVLMLIVSIIIMLMINQNLTLILIISMIIYLIIGIIVSKITYRKVLENIDYQTNFNSKMLEYINMISSIKHLNLTNKFLEKIEYVLSKYLLSNFKFKRFFNKANLMKSFIIENCLFFINSIGLYQVLNNKINIVDLFTFNILLNYVIEPVENIINLLPKYNYIKASFARISEFNLIEEENYNNKKIDLNGDIIFANVSYSYNNYDYILKNVNLIIREKDHVLLNGVSGSGKSTICKLISKDYLLNSGKILIGNDNISDISINNLRDNILYISQQENLFMGTIKENILAGRNVGKKLFNKICDICKIEDIVKNKRLRYESLIEPSISNLSGGEKQRIILARGLLKRSNIIILDEALSEVDKETESLIIKSIRKHFKDKTIIYISHKNQKDNFEKIIEMEKINGLL